ncbi:Phosphatidylinositol 3- and 4-kinase family protein [Tritrichomonas foetus]|uniref:phosphatidylinositol 3-kinase n=1 Tax=Tritrichomonas foetus TaxID=1144522 RepID=A0A1J4KM76_9EUKA|nr:Phosphatidylinositol 3- and 4-kinase family protein [Tritrichomonas foetus]|eukprot:OHT12323.1 Phosphatidylinositol 3- and 4-kinase family protein [Tritrichomonas foetus]
MTETRGKSRQAGNRRREETKEFNSNVKIELKSLVVDVAHDISFDIYKFFGIEVPVSLIEEWDSDAPLPFKCEVECVLISNNRPLTCPITLSSNQYTITHPTFPNISLLHNISREQHSFVWDQKIELPIFYSELPLDSIISFKFYARLFQTQPRLIGSTSVQLFTKRNRRLRHGPFILTFGDSSNPLSPAKETPLQKHIRRLATGKTQSYEFIDDQLRCVSDSLHPDDANRFFNALLNPLQPPELSNTSQFVRINVVSPAKEPSTIVIHRDLILNSIDCHSSLNPCQRLYHDLAHSQGPAKSALLKDSNITEILNKIKALPPLAELKLFHTNFICNHYAHCLADPALMPALFRSLSWEDEEEETTTISNHLKECKPIDVEYALEFFTSRYERKQVREFAVRCIRNIDKNELLLYIPQLLQAVKAKYTDGLSDILVQHARDDHVFASTLYWNSSIEASEDKRIGALMKNLMESITPEVKDQLDLQRQLIDNIFKLLEASKVGKGPAQIREKTRDLLQNDPEFSKLQHFDKKIRLPLDPTLFAVGIDPFDVKVFQSKLCPVNLSFHLDDGRKYRVIFKIGDDMRQDQLIIQLFEVMDHIFQRASLKLPITAYKTLAFTKDFGCCQFIENSSAIRDINASGKTIRDFLMEDKEPIEPKIEKFTASLAAYCVMTYVLKIGDRHDNNILVTRDGRLLHIDYGYILGDVTKPFTPPLKLSSEMIETIGNDGLSRISGWAGPAFNSLRKRARLILVLIELMFTAPLTCFQQNPMRRLQQVENSLLLNCTEIEAMNSLQATFSESLNSKMQVLWDAVHVMALAANGPSATA